MSPDHEDWLLPYNSKATKQTDVKIHPVKDLKNRRILTKEALFEDIERADNSSANSNDTSKSNKNTVPKHTNTAMPSASVSKVASSKPMTGFVSASSNSSDNNGITLTHSQWKKTETKNIGTMSKLNTWKKRFEVAEKVQPPKIMNMMQKMGWSGGGLGKTGAGIKEPIVPVMDYAVETKGFGKPEKPVKPRKPSKVNRREMRAKDPAVIARRELSQNNKRLFKQNVLKYILEFVIDEGQVAMLFDHSLHNGQRKFIHGLVQEIQGQCQLQGKSKMNEGHERMMMNEIAKRNRYVLQTQSEGEMPQRFLCLFKEAPPTMYLVTHYTLKGKESDFVKKEEVLHYRYTTNSKRERKLTNFIKRHTGKIYEIVQESPDSFVCKVYTQRERNTYNNTCHKIPAKDNKRNINKHKTDENISIVVVNSDSEEENEKSDDEFEYGFVEMEKEIQPEHEIKTKDETTKTDTKICVKANPDELLLKAIVKHENARNASSLTGDSGVKIKLVPENEINSINYSNDKNGDRTKFLRHNLNMCFSEFITGDVFKEFKFLGQFDDEELQVLNEFLEDFLLKKRGETAVDGEFESVWGCSKLAYKRNMNGGFLIYKVS